MKSIILPLALICLVQSYPVEIEVHHEHGKATSYQNIQMEHYHAVPTYVKSKEFLEHPVSLGQTSSQVEVHHGGKHDLGYGLASVSSDVHQHGDGGGEGGHEQLLQLHHNFGGHGGLELRAGHNPYYNHHHQSLEHYQGEASQLSPQSHQSESD